MAKKNNIGPRKGEKPYKIEVDGRTVTVWRDTPPTADDIFEIERIVRDYRIDLAKNVVAFGLMRSI